MNESISSTEFTITRYGLHPCVACHGAAWYRDEGREHEECENESNGCGQSVRERVRAQRRAAYEEQQRREQIKPTRGSTLGAGSFLFDTPELPRATCGEGARIVAARNEATMFAATIGVGKTTAAQRYMRARVGIGPSEFLGLPVQLLDGRFGYIAADRPDQAKASFRRMVSPEDREILNERIEWHHGPPEQRITEEPESLAKLARKMRVQALVIDSAKDVVLGSLADDSTGSAVAMALQICAADGIEVVICHHSTKLGASTPDLNSIYGSTLIPATCGSVFFMTGADGRVSFHHVKSPAERVDVEARLDSMSGEFYVTDLAELASGDGTTAREAALALYGSDERGIVEKARRKLESVPNIMKVGNGTGRGNAARYVLEESHAEETA